MKSVWLFAPRGEARRVLDRIAAMGLCHIADCGLGEAEGHDALDIHRVYPEAADIERRVQMLTEILTTLSGFRKSKKSFLENFIPTPVEVHQADVRKALTETDIEELHRSAMAQEREATTVAQSLDKARDDLKALSLLSGVKSAVPGANRQRNVAAFLGIMTLGNLEKLRADERLPETSAVAAVAQRKRDVIVQAACPAGEGDDLLALLREFGMAVIEPEPETVSIEEYLAHRRDEADRFRQALDAVNDKLRALAREHYARVEMALGYWEERLRIAKVTGFVAESKRLTAIRAYIREADLQELKKRMQADLPHVTLDVRDPEPGEPVPVSLRNNKVFAPVEFLVGMFGRPNYFTFDPTPYIVTAFLVFFGVCFGDAIYGAVLIIVGSLLARKYRNYPGPRGMFSLLALAGVPTTIVGVISGAWASDLLTAQYIGEGSALVAMRNSLMGFDVIGRTMLALAIALMMGVANQFLSLICLMIRNVRQGDVKAAIFDGAFWMLVLPAVVIGAAGLFANVPSGLNTAAFSAAGVGALGLILTQGRAEKSFIGKAVIGIVSLYGIVGTYGITAFIGDILSYSRLLALGLTTSIVGMCFNLIGGMAREIPYVGTVCFVVIVLGGHTMNFLISILGAFVHSARLIFVEFFGKFYQGDGAAFAPIGRWSGRIRVVDAQTVWPD